MLLGIVSYSNIFTIRLSDVDVIACDDLRMAYTGLLVTFQISGGFQLGVFVEY